MVEWLRRVGAGEAAVTLVQLPGCRGAWLWNEGAGRAPRYVTYIVRTDVSWAAAIPHDLCSTAGHLSIITPMPVAGQLRSVACRCAGG